MGYIIKKHKDYFHLSVDEDRVGEIKLDNLKRECFEYFKKTPYMIFNTRGIKVISADWEHFFTEVDHKARQHDGAVILTEVKRSLVEKFEKIGLMEVPDDEEAINFIRMEQLENQFHVEDDDEEDF